MEHDGFNPVSTITFEKTEIDIGVGPETTVLTRGIEPVLSPPIPMNYLFTGLFI
jgi:hypothetical protein